MTADELMRRIDTQLSHVWMVRTFLKHCEEAEEFDELREVHRGLYDFMLALGSSLQSSDADGYVKQARKKLRRLRAARDLYLEAQPEISTHTNFQLAAQSLQAAVAEIESLLDIDTPAGG